MPRCLVMLLCGMGLLLELLAGCGEAVTIVRYCPKGTDCLDIVVPKGCVQENNMLNCDAFGMAELAKILPDVKQRVCRDAEDEPAYAQVCQEKTPRQDTQPAWNPLQEQNTLGQNHTPLLPGMWLWQAELGSRTERAVPVEGQHIDWAMSISGDVLCHPCGTGTCCVEERTQQERVVPAEPLPSEADCPLGVTCYAWREPDGTGVITIGPFKGQEAETSPENLLLRNETLSEHRDFPPPGGCPNIYTTPIPCAPGEEKLYVHNTNGCPEEKCVALGGAPPQHPSCQEWFTVRGHYLPWARVQGMTLREPHVSQYVEKVVFPWRIQFELVTGMRVLSEEVEYESAEQAKAEYASLVQQHRAWVACRKEH